MKLLSFLVFTTLLLNGCFKSDPVTKEECLSKGMILKKENILNYRTGKYEDRYSCVKKI